MWVRGLPEKRKGNAEAKKILVMSRFKSMYWYEKLGLLGADGLKGNINPMGEFRNYWHHRETKFLERIQHFSIHLHWYSSLARGLFLNLTTNNGKSPADWLHFIFQNKILFLTILKNFYVRREGKGPPKLFINQFFNLFQVALTTR